MSAKTIGKVFGIFLLIIGIGMLVGSYAMTQVTGPVAIKDVAKQVLSSQAGISQVQIEEIKAGLQEMCQAAGNPQTLILPPELIAQGVPNISVECAKVPTMTESDFYGIMADTASQSLTQQLTCTDFINCIKSGEIMVFATPMATQFFTMMMYIGIILLIAGIALTVASDRKVSSILKSIGTALLISGVVCLAITFIAPLVVPSDAKLVAEPLVNKMTFITLVAGAIMLVIGIIMTAAGILTGKKRAEKSAKPAKPVKKKK